MGYAGGTSWYPTYVSIGDHSESVQIDYDPTKISYLDLLRAFWSGHDPTHGSRSRQYASIIFTHNEEQRRQAEASKEEVEREQGRAVHTEIVAYRGFTQAEDYHQKHSLHQFRAFDQELSRIYPSVSDFVASTAVSRVNGYLGGEGTYEALEKEVDGLGLSAERKEELLRLVRRDRGKAACPLPEKKASPAAR